MEEAAGQGTENSERPGDRGMAPAREMALLQEKRWQTEPTRGCPGGAEPQPHGSPAQAAEGAADHRPLLESCGAVLSAELDVLVFRCGSGADRDVRLS